MPLKFSQSQHLKNRAQFDRVMRGNIFTVHGKLKLYAIANSTQDYSRLGLIISRKTGCACWRNRQARVIKEAFRLERAGFSSKLDVVGRIAPGYQTLGLEELRQLFRELGK